MQKFLWGAATSSHQIEGNNFHNDWWKWEREGKSESKEVSGIACDHWNRFKEDIALAKKLGLNTYRFSIEWSRVEPRPGEWDRLALDRYREIVSECERLGILPMVTLFHFTIPQWLAEQGGFIWEASADLFAAYVRRVVETIGPRVPLWVTLNEPMALVVGQYLGEFFPPAKFSPKNVTVASRNMLRAHWRAYDILHKEIYRREGPWKEDPIQVGIAHNLADFMPFRKFHPIEYSLARIFRRFYNRSWLDAITGRKQHFGVTGFIPYAAQVRRALGRNTADFIGVNYYTKLYTRWQKEVREPVANSSFPMGIAMTKPGDPKNDLGWALHPKGLGRILRFVNRYHLPIYITENGIADSSDEKRAKFIVSHLKQIADAIDSGIDVRGYYHWSLLDNFEWHKGYAPRFGLYAVDYETQKRSPRSSAEMYRRIIERHLETVGSFPQRKILEEFEEKNNGLAEETDLNSARAPGSFSRT